ncbi:MAG: peptide chain release factor N(5)-glutamine methyltransferase [Comamonas sp.]|jgi:release factor glutamine methyltransferase|uniref:peptide chain release factor N(5)-glutamine methyltransferase n=1 Tax=Comamonas sp. TaxID=34028 RepID=UPI00281F9ADC|nr:peptide chain release factor N(5)-glutamine methyltransferase [Comamonas sp.]MDR0213631.1 peptide chain release factor N(5)-glutamine methyltransferase [Comamonas sp.]
MTEPASSSFTVAQALAQAARQSMARVDAQMLLLHLMQQPAHARAWLITHDTDVLNTEQQQRWAQLCILRQQGTPVAYLTGNKEFYGLSLSVDRRVLDPRPDTETLVDWALELMPEGQPTRVVDLGTGSGAIALALQSQRPAAQVFAVDASADALAVAQNNAQRLKLPVQFAHGSWLEPLAGQAALDLVVSNPPYIRSDDPHLAALTHEPLSALASGADGLEDIRAIVSQAPQVLKAGGWLIFEHGWDQAGDVAQLMRNTGFVQVQHRRDLADIERCTGGQWPGKT